MAPIKFEEHIREKFEEREIKPSDNAWEIISGALENTPNEKKRGFIWYAIAASVIGLLVASLFFFMGQNDAVLDNSIVNQDKNQVNIKGENELPDIINDLNIEEIKLVESNTKSTKKLDHDVFRTKKQEEAKQNLSTEKEMAFITDLQDAKEVKISKTRLIDDQALINTKISELIAQVDSLELNNKTITDAEIDALLHKAQNEILAQRIFKDNNSVDAMALLSEAEDELNISFRNQLFETLKNGYLKVRTAVADRNN